ncbi:hypothetical protein LTR15_004272 [Elasticomyces elasticus]|nr:hypothetical protein LTR15_004272 [Elasticomyces elasticus]
MSTPQEASHSNKSDTVLRGTQIRSLLTEIKLAQHDAHTPNNLDEYSKVQLWLFDECSTPMNHVGPSPEAWQDLVLRDPLAAEIEVAFQDGQNQEQERQERRG